MATVAGGRALYSTQRAFLRAWRDGLAQYVDQAAGVLLRESGRDGKVAPNSAERVQEQIAAVLRRAFVGGDGRTVWLDDRPQALYPSLLDTFIARMTYDAILPHTAMLKKRLPADVQAWLMTARPIQENVTSNPLAGYDSLHQFVDPQGYTLSSKVWRMSVDTITRIDKLVEQGIRTGRSAMDIARDLEKHLLPSMAGQRTTMPYGTDASYPALRLARTEIAAAHGRATVAAGKANPYVTGMNWRLSARHPKFDICDIHARNSPHALDSEVVQFFPAHPNCLCRLEPVVGKTQDEVVDDLRALMMMESVREMQEAPITALKWREIMERLLGSYLTAQFIVNYPIAEARGL